MSWHGACWDCFFSMFPPSFLIPRCPAPSWTGRGFTRINQAVAQRMAFGRDIIFTLGPYASVYTHAYHPATVWMMLLGCLLFDICYACCFAWLVRRAAWSWTPVLAAMLVAPLITQDDWFFSFILLEALLVFRLLDEGPGEDRMPITAALAAAIFGCAGMLPLVKGSMLVLQACVLVLYLAFLIFHRRWTMAIICSLAPTIGMLFFWFAAGQRMANLPGFFSASIQLISGYSEAMSLPGPRRQVALFMAGALALLLAIVLARRLMRSL